VILLNPPPPLCLRNFSFCGCWYLSWSAELGYHRNERRAIVFFNPRPSLVSSRPCGSTMNTARRLIRRFNMKAVLHFPCPAPCTLHPPPCTTGRISEDSVSFFESICRIVCFWFTYRHRSASVWGSRKPTTPAPRFH
jgi:hypothetical protein